MQQIKPDGTSAGQEKILITEDVLEKKEIRLTKWDHVHRLGVRCFSLPILERDELKIF
jgi:hypothetical protein